MEFIYKLLNIATAIAEEAGAVDPAAAAEELSGAAALVSIIGSLLPMILIFVVFYFLMIRPQRKKDKQIKEMLANLKKGDRICTRGGIYGTIVNIKDDDITLAVGKDNLTIVVARWAIATVDDIAIENDIDPLN